jgi:Carboxypeptidase regulatory-like domain
MTKAVVRPRGGGLLLPLLLVLLVLPATAQTRRRTVHGLVTDPYGLILRGAVVRIENTATLWVRTYITQKDGSYHFHGLDPNVDYKLTATFKGATSSEKTVSRFDSHQVVRIDLHVDWNKAVAGAYGS